MKKIFFIAAVLVASVTANAKTWRINPNEAAKPDFTTIKAACDANKVTKGDSLYCEPGLYTNANDNKITKNGLTILGPGFGYKGNVGSTSTNAEAYFSADLYINADTIHLVGIRTRRLYLEGNNSFIYRKNITVERCYMNNFYDGGYNVQYLTLRDNFINMTSGEYYSIYVSGSVLQNIEIENNIIISEYNYLKNAIVVSAKENTSALIAHNTIVIKLPDKSTSAIRADYSVIRDNIIINTNSQYGKSHLFNASDISTCDVYNNVFSLTEDNADAAFVSAYSAKNSFAGATTANTFTCTKIGEAEATYYQLKDGSVAKNKAYQGEDCGAFAGSWPFVVEGRPQGLPYIYDVYAPTTPTDDKLTITFKVKANNE